MDDLAPKMQNPADRIRLIVFDIDGTLVDDSKTLKKKTISVIHQLQERGLSVSFATGKTYPSVLDFLNILKIKVPVILSNGALIQHPGGEIVLSKFIPPGLVEEIAQTARTYDGDLALYTPDRIFVEKETFNTDHMKCIFKEKIEAIGTWVAVREHFSHICKVIWVNRQNRTQVERLTIHLKEIYNGRLSFSTASPDAIEGMLSGVSKKTGLTLLAESLQIPLEAVMVFGDQINDYEMIEIAGIGIAVGNAIEEIKAISDHVVGTNNEEGPANFLREFFDL